MRDWLEAFGVAVGMTVACAIPFLVILLLVASCSVDQGRCLASEKRMETQMIQTGSIPVGGGVSMPIYTYYDEDVDHCTQWEFPEGRTRAR
jgi:hypothetical protein